MLPTGGTRFCSQRGVFRRYHSKGLEIIGVSKDYNKEAWVNAINCDSIDEWHHVPVAEDYAARLSKVNKYDIYAKYFVQGIPLLILIDRSGKIIGRWKEYNKEQEEMIDKKLAEVFNEN